jgi:predicted phage terminase large subunit-like protein
MGALQYVHVPGYAALLLRRSLTELKQPGALLDRASTWLSNTPAKFHADEHTWYFPTLFPNGRPGPPAKLQFGYLGDFRVEERYQGAEYQYVGVDEASHFENDQAPTYLFSRLRKNVCDKHQLKRDESGDMVPNYVDSCQICQMFKSVPIRFRMASNPGGPGHLWLKQRYEIEKEIFDRVDPITKEVTKAVRFIGKNPDKPFIPSKLTDNTFIDQKMYRSSLQELDEIRRLQLEEGDWDVSPDSRFQLNWAKFYKSRGDYFELNKIVYPYEQFDRVFITVDVAATVKQGMIDQDVTKNGPSFTVISVWGLTKDYQLVWLYMRRFRQEVPQVVDQIVEVAKQFKPRYVKIETNGVGLGVAQLVALKGINVLPIKKAVDKIQNATNAIYRMKTGRIWFPESAPWVKTAMDEIFTWTGHPGVTDDIVDTLSDACNDVTWGAGQADPIFQSSAVMPGSRPTLIPMSFKYPSLHQNGGYLS